MDKQEITAVLHRELGTVMEARRAAATDPALQARRHAVRRFQAERMATTHADLLANTESRPAARFFLDDLYGCQDLTARDANLARIVPTMERLLPETALRTIAEAISLDALSEKLDRVMAEALGPAFDDQDYVAAFRTLTDRADRERQIAHVESVGMSLCKLVRVPMVSMTVRMMRGPARMAQLLELHEFLERGYRAFKDMPKPEAFVNTIVNRERVIMAQVYAGSERPFVLNESRTSCF